MKGFESNFNNFKGDKGDDVFDSVEVSEIKEKKIIGLEQQLNDIEELKKRIIENNRYKDELPEEVSIFLKKLGQIKENLIRRINNNEKE